MQQHKIRVGVLRGGPSLEYDVSLKTGEAVLKNLPEHYLGVDVFISRDGVWHYHGLPRKPLQILKHLDVVFNAMHGEYGEDGKVQQILDYHQTPYTGSQSFASALAMNKAMAKEVYRRQGIKTPVAMVVTASKYRAEDIHSIFRSFHLPAIVKPIASGSSFGVEKVENFHELGETLPRILAEFNSVLIEEFISGREATCGVVENFRGQKLYSLLPVEIIKPASKDFFDYEAKYGGGSQEICPGNFSVAEKMEIQKLAKEAHQALGLRHYSRSDFIVHPKRGIYTLETNTLPGLTSESLFPKSLEAVGSDLPNFLDHLVQLAIQN